MSEKTKIDLVNSKAHIAAAELENGYEMEFEGTVGDQIVLFVKTIAKFAKILEKEQNKNPLATIESLCRTAEMALVFEDDDDSKGDTEEDKSEPKAEKEDDKFKRVSKMLDEILDVLKK